MVFNSCCKILGPQLLPIYSPNVLVHCLDAVMKALYFIIMEGKCFLMNTGNPVGTKEDDELLGKKKLHHLGSSCTVPQRVPLCVLQGHSRADGNAWHCTTRSSAENMGSCPLTLVQHRTYCRQHLGEITGVCLQKEWWQK